MLTVAISPLAQSRAASVHVPFGVVSSVAQEVTVEGKLVGPMADAASAEKVPVNGDEDEENAAPPSELMTVFVKLSPLDPSRLTRLRLPPLGAIILNVRSPSKVMVTLLSTTDTSTTVAPAGIPLTVILLVAPVAVLSGTVNALVEPKVLVKSTAGVDGAVSNCDDPKQMLVEDGVTEKVDGPVLTVTVINAGLPHPFEYCMDAVPAATPVITPVSEPAVAMDVLRLFHVPPVAVSDNVVVVPMHSVVVPVMADGLVFTVTATVAAVPQPVL